MVQHLRIVLLLLQELVDFKMNWEKSILKPTMIIDFLGTGVNSGIVMFGIPKEKVLKAKKLVNMDTVRDDFKNNRSSQLLRSNLFTNEETLLPSATMETQSVIKEQMGFRKANFVEE